MLCASFQNHQWIQTGVQSGDAKLGSTLATFCPIWPWNFTDGLKKNRAPLLYYVKLSASFQSHLWIKNGATARKRPILSCVTLKFERRHWKTIGRLFYATSSFVHHSITNGEFKLELQSRNAQFGPKPMILLVVWTWNLTDDLEKQKGTSLKTHLALCIISSPHVNSNWSYSPFTVKLGFDLFYLDLWPLTLTFCMDITSVIGNHSW